VGQLLPNSAQFLSQLQNTSSGQQFELAQHGVDLPKSNLPQQLQQQQQQSGRNSLREYRHSFQKPSVDQQVPHLEPPKSDGAQPTPDTPTTVSENDEDIIFYEDVRNEEVKIMRHLS
jgi:hypothetical protein